MNKRANKAPEVVVQTFTIHLNETRGYSDNPMKKILEKTPMNDQFSSFYSEKTQERDHFYEKLFIGQLKVIFGRICQTTRINAYSRGCRHYSW